MWSSSVPYLVAAGQGVERPLKKDGPPPGCGALPRLEVAVPHPQRVGVAQQLLLIEQVLVIRKEVVDGRRCRRLSAHIPRGARRHKRQQMSETGEGEGFTNDCRQYLRQEAAASRLRVARQPHPGKWTRRRGTSLSLQLVNAEVRKVLHASSFNSLACLHS